MTSQFILISNDILCDFKCHHTFEIKFDISNDILRNTCFDISDDILKFKVTSQIIFTETFKMTF